MAEFVYLPLEDAKKIINTKVNLFAVVVEIGTPKQSRGTDHFVTLKIVDQSYPVSGFSVSFFAESTDKLPHVKSGGDIISLHRVKMKLHNGVAHCVFDKRFSFFALFEGKIAAAFDPYQCSKNYRAPACNGELLLRLRQWLPNYESCSGLKQLRGIKVDKFFDLECKVLHVSETSKGEPAIFVWDGTDTPPVCLESDLNAEGNNNLPICIEAFSLPRDVLCKFPCVGSVLMVILDKSIKGLAWFHNDTWVKLCNITFELESGMWKGLLHPHSKIFLLPNDNQNVVMYERNFCERNGSYIERQPMSSFPRPSHITETDYEDIVYATLMESLVNDEVTHLFRTVVRVVAAYPWMAAELCSSAQGGQYIVRLTLEDPTARIHAYIIGADGEHFFGGYPSSEELGLRMNTLLGISGDVAAAADGCVWRDPPWIGCCLKSYYLDKSNPWGSRRYKIFGTCLTGGHR